MRKYNRENTSAPRYYVMWPDAPLITLRENLSNIRRVRENLAQGKPAQWFPWPTID